MIRERLFWGPRHPAELALLDLYYSDRANPRSTEPDGVALDVRQHLRHCARCAEAYAALAADLDGLAMLGRAWAESPEPPGSWHAQADRIRQRLIGVVPVWRVGLVPGVALAAARPGGQRVPRRWPIAAALGTAAVLTIATWASWTLPRTAPVTTTAAQDQLDDQLLHDIGALVEAPLGSLAGDGAGWPGAALPTTSAL